MSYVLFISYNECQYTIRGSKSAYTQNVQEIKMTEYNVKNVHALFEPYGYGTYILQYEPL